ncbi:group II intron maturase-specific domain-containing protein [Microtetraspora glauca]|uniref:Group II intron maturase-specific domain-containing protein n=1 Tax=Microtetraspora glauca TaxID=1996 RepID=A0ABV3GE84_MICGL
MDPKAVSRLKDRIRESSSRRWSVSMPCGIGRLNAYVTGWMAYFHLADTPGCSRIWMSGFAAGCGRSAGRNGRSPRPGAVT